MQPVWQTHLGEGAARFNPGYHQKPREEVLKHIDWSPRVILDIGCAAGASSAALKAKHPGSRAIGVELNPEAAEYARARLDQVVCGDLAQLDMESVGIAKGSVDTVLMFDVLEHMYDPWRALTSLKPALAPDARIVASIPNAFNMQLFQQLAAGSFQYDIHGLLDITHIRFFTLRDMLALFAQTGYKVLRGHGIPHPPQLMPPIRYAGNDRVESDHVIIKNLPPERLQELFMIQFVLIAQPA